MSYKINGVELTEEQYHTMVKLLGGGYIHRDKIIEFRNEWDQGRHRDVLKPQKSST